MAKENNWKVPIYADTVDHTYMGIIEEGLMSIIWKRARRTPSVEAFWSGNKKFVVSLSVGQMILKISDISKQSEVSRFKLHKALDNLKLFLKSEKTYSSVKGSVEVSLDFEPKPYGLLVSVKNYLEAVQFSSSFKGSVEGSVQSNLKATSKQFKSKLTTSNERVERVENEKSVESASFKTSTDVLVSDKPTATEKNVYGNVEINGMLSALKARVGIDDFADTSKWSRVYAKNCLSLMHNLGKPEFIRRLDKLLEDDFHRKNCNKVKYIYYNIKGFIEPKDQGIVFIS